MKVGIVGGSFDPIHYGHIQMAKTALQDLACDEVWFMPTKSTPLKDRSLTADVHRLAMIQRVMAYDDRFRLCTLEMDREGKSYTIDTVKTLKQKYPAYEFIWMIGNDQLAQFDQWKDPEELTSLIQFVCVDRDGQLVPTEYPIQRIHMEAMPVSSSEIRQGNKLNYVPYTVLGYIYEHRLYVENFIAAKETRHRYKHSVSVAHLCEEMALANGLDGQKAYYIGLFHDIAKNMDVQHMEQWMDAICPENKKWAVPVWHGFVGSEIVDRVFYLDDPQIKNAIYHHVLGDDHDDPYAMIVFCADKTDPLRGYDSTDLINQCKADIYQGFWAVKNENDKYLEEGK